MSVILNALRSQKTSEKKTAPTHQEGLFVGGSNFERAGLSRFLWLLLKIAFLLIALGGAGALIWWWQGTAKPSETAMPVAVVPPQEIAAKLAKEAQALFSDGHFEQSLAVYQNALEQDPNNASLLNDLGMAFLKDKQLGNAEEHFRRAVELDPKCAVCLNNLGYLATVSGNTTEAETNLKKAAEIDLKYADPYFNLGVLYEKTGDIENAINAYQDYLLRSPDTNAKPYLDIKQHLRNLLKARIMEN